MPDCYDCGYDVPEWAVFRSSQEPYRDAIQQCVTCALREERSDRLESEEKQ